MGSINAAACFEGLDIQRFAAQSAVNYLHCGDVLDRWFDKRDAGAAGLQLSLRAEPVRIRRPPGFVAQVLLPARRPPEPCWSDPDCFEQSLSESVEWRRQFRKLGCRGFSYQLDLEMAEYNRQRPPTGHLRPQIDLRVALMPARRLFYPASVTRYFASTDWYGNHYYQGDMPSIAFCFGRRIERIWYVFTIQSDVSSSGTAAVREHFRGWRNVLFANLVGQAFGKADAIRLCRANDVIRACFPGTRRHRETPEQWRRIYDRTAQEWQMRMVKAPEAVDIQLYDGQPPVYAQMFHQFDLATAYQHLAARV